jgi:hypothetical protein
MNTKQKIVLWIGISIIGILLAHPPYKLILGDVKLNIGHRNIITPSGGFTKDELEISGSAMQRGAIIKIDIFRLLLECVLVGAITKGGLCAFKDTKDKTT